MDASEPCTASLPSRQSGVLIHMIAALGRDRDMTASHGLPLWTSRKEIALVQPVCALAMWPKQIIRQCHSASVGATEAS